MTEFRLPAYLKYPFTAVWAVFYIFCLILSGSESYPVTIGMYLILTMGIPLTLFVAGEWSIHTPGRKVAGIIVAASIAVWGLTAWLVMNEIAWHLFWPVNTVALLVVGYTVGYWLCGEVEKRSHLIPVTIVGTLVDIWSVFKGPSKQVAEEVTEHVQEQVATWSFKPPPLAEFAIVSFPQPGASFMTPTFGFGDLVFIALFMAAARKFRLSLVKTFLLVAAGLAASIVIAFVFEMAVPALPLICGFFLVGNFRELIRKDQSAGKVNGAE